MTTAAEQRGTEAAPLPRTRAESADGPQPVVLKIRRRKFNRTPQKGEIVITRRLFRTGESEYLLNGKLCRLRDIQDIFMGTGLGPESYAIIGQERIGQLLSSKPHDRRAIIEEAAGITRFKTKKRLAELRLESCEAEPGARRRHLRRSHAADEQPEASGRRRRNDSRRCAMNCAAVCASCWRAAWRRWTREQARLEQEIAALTEQIAGGAAEIGTMEASQHSLTERGYELDHEGQDAQNRANSVGGRAGTRSGTGTQQRRARERTRSADGCCRRRTGADADPDWAGIAEERTQQHKLSSKQRPARPKRSTRRWRRASTKRAPRQRKCSTQSVSSR